MKGVDYDSILFATDSNVVNRTEYYATGKGLPDQGVPMTEMPYIMNRDEYVLSAFIFMFLIASVVLYRGRLLLAYRLKTFFTTKRVYSDENVNDNSNETVGVLLIVCVGALSQSLVAFNCLSMHFSFPTYLDIPYWLVGGGFLVFFSYIYLRGIIYSLVNWIFFDSEARRRWNSGYYMLATLSSYVFFAFSIVTAFFQLNVVSVIWCGLFIYILYEILLLYKLLANFKIKNYGFLLIILYFCSVEILPLMLLWRFADWIFNGYYVNNLLS